MNIKANGQYVYSKLEYTFTLLLSISLGLDTNNTIYLSTNIPKILKIPVHLILHNAYYLLAINS